MSLGLITPSFSSPNSRLSSPVFPNGTLGSSSSGPTEEVSPSFHISSTHSAPQPSNSQSALSRSLSFTGSWPMLSSTFTSNQSFISSQPTRTASKPEVSNKDISSMSSSTTSAKQISTERQNDATVTQATSSIGVDSENTVSDSPTKTSAKDNNQSTKTGGTSSSDATTTATSETALSPATATGGGKKSSTAVRQSLSSTVEVVSVRPSNTSTILMTVTSSPETTLSLPSSISVTNPKDGNVVLSAPSVITVLSTSTGSDGAFVTHTQLVANPPPVSVDGKTSTGFLEHHGQVAGVFTVVGVFAAAFVFALIWFVRRHRRRQRRKEWFASLRQYPPSPFAQASPDSQMRSIHTATETIHDPHTVNYDSFGHRPHSSLESTVEGSMGLGLVGSGNAQAGVLVPLRRPLSGGDPFRDPPHVPRNTPVSFSPNHDRLNGSSGASIAPSSPSIYPESLPPTTDTTANPPSPVDTEPKTQAKYFSEPLLRRSLSMTSHPDAPPRPPRSHLREFQKGSGALPLTPPASVSSHGHSDQEPQFLFHPMRRNMPHTRREESHT